MILQSFFAFSEFLWRLLAGLRRLLRGAGGLFATVRRAERSALADKPQRKLGFPRARPLRYRPSPGRRRSSIASAVTTPSIVVSIGSRPSATQTIMGTVITATNSATLIQTADLVLDSSAVAGIQSKSSTSVAPTAWLPAGPGRRGIHLVSVYGGGRLGRPHFGQRSQPLPGVSTASSGASQRGHR